MARKTQQEEAPREAPRRIWRDALIHLASRKGDDFTAGDVAKEIGLDYNGAAKLLFRLHNWSHIRQVGFEDATAKNPGRHPGGRRRKVYEITDKGRRAAAWKGRA
jgi:predicted ArsR family transcriptional regulator